LLNEPKTIVEIKSYFDISSPEILPRIKEMENKNLIYKENKQYVLTPVGKIVAHLFQPLVNTLHVLEDNEQFWLNHDIGAIPRQLLMRIGELGNIQRLECDIEEPYALHKECLENISKSRKVKAISPIVHPMLPGIFLQMAENGIEISIVLTRNAINKLRREYSSLFAQALSFKNVSLYISDEEIKLTCIATDIFIGTCLFYKNGTFDSKTELISYDKSALVWGEELFDYFKDRSQKIENLQEMAMVQAKMAVA
jgi:predicted transcriptional regulator